MGYGHIAWARSVAKGWGDADKKKNVGQLAHIHLSLFPPVLIQIEEQSNAVLLYDLV